MKWGDRTIKLFLKMEKLITSVVLALIIGIQALNIGAVSRIQKYNNQLDDASNKSYSAADAQTQTFSYFFGFTICVAGLTVIIYIVLLIVKLINSAINAKLQEILFYVVALLQFSYGVGIALYVSKLVQPYGPNGGLYSYSDLYVEMYRISLADTIIMWVICVPGSFVFTLLNIPSFNSTAKPQTSELGLRA